MCKPAEAVQKLEAWSLLKWHMYLKYVSLVKQYKCLLCLSLVQQLNKEMLIVSMPDSYVHASYLQQTIFDTPFLILGTDSGQNS